MCAAGILAGLAVATPIVVRMAMTRVRAEMVQACEPENPAIKAVASVIRREAMTPIEEVALVSVAADHLLDYDPSLRVYGPGIPTVSEILERRRAAHWVFPRGDCKESAVLAGSLLSALDIRWEPEMSLVQGHAWIRVHLGGGSWDIMAISQRGCARPGSAFLRVLSLVAGCSATPIQAPISRFADPAAASLFARRLGLTGLETSDAAALGLVIVTPGNVFNHSPVDFTGSIDSGRLVGQAWNRARVAGFPLGEPL